MKRAILFINLALVCTLAMSQAPESFNYQAIPFKSTGGVFANQVMQVRISILASSITGSSVYTETFSATTSSSGILNLQIGKGNIVSGNFSKINWGENSYFIKVEIDPSGGTTYVDFGVTQLLSVPYSLYSKQAGNGFSGSYSDLTNKPILFSGSYNDLTNKPTLFNGSWNNITDKPVIFNGTWSALTDKPTTVSGYGITDALTTSHPADKITADDISNWNSAYNWGDHSTAGYLLQITEVTDEFISSASQTIFTLSHAPSTKSKIKMYINGVRISNTAFTISDSNLTYVPANNGSYSLAASDRIQFDYSY